MLTEMRMMVVAAADKLHPEKMLDCLWLLLLPLSILFKPSHQQYSLIT